MPMTITNKKFYECDMDKDGEVFAEADGKRGNFRGHVTGKIHSEDIGIIKTKMVYETEYQVHGNNYSMTNIDGRGVDLKTGVTIDITTRESMEHMIKASLNCAYDNYKKHLRGRRMG